jgi:DNA-binding response OmpR family regulator
MAKRILVIENDEYILNCIRLVLSTEGFQVLGDSSPANIGAHILQFDPHLILLDLVSIGGEGSSALKSIRISPKSDETPVLLLSCASGLKASPGLQSKDILLKPFDLNTLIERVNEIMN